MGGVDNIFHLRQLAASPDFQLAAVWFYQPRRGFQPCNQRFAAAIENNARALAAQARHPVGKGFRTHAGRQAAADANHIELPQPAQRIINETLPVRRGHFETGEVEIGHFAIFFRQLDVNTGTPLHHLEAVGDTQLAKQLLEAILVIFTEEAADGDVDAKIFQHLRHVDTFACRMQASGTYQVHFATFDFRGETHQVVCRI